MRRFNGLLSGAIVVLLGVAGAWTQPVAIAQEATPAGEAMMPAGITSELVTLALGAELAGPSDLFLVRFGFEPGAGFPIEASDPTAGILLVESGTFTVQVEGPVSVTRGTALAEFTETAEETGAMMPPMEAIAAGEAITLEAGDAAYVPGNVGGEIRNDGEEPAVALVFLVGPSMGMMGEATPAP